MKKQHDKYTEKKIAKFLEVFRNNFYYFLHRTLTKRAMENAEYQKKLKAFMNVCILSVYKRVAILKEKRG